MCRFKELLMKRSSKSIKCSHNKDSEPPVRRRRWYESVRRAVAAVSHQSKQFSAKTNKNVQVERCFPPASTSSSSPGSVGAFCCSTTQPTGKYRTQATSDARNTARTRGDVKAGSQTETSVNDVLPSSNRQNRAAPLCVTCGHVTQPSRCTAYQSKMQEWQVATVASHGDAQCTGHRRRRRRREKDESDVLGGYIAPVTHRRRRYATDVGGRDDERSVRTAADSGFFSTEPTTTWNSCGVETIRDKTGPVLGTELETFGRQAEGRLGDWLISQTAEAEYDEAVTTAVCTRRQRRNTSSLRHGISTCRRRRHLVSRWWAIQRRCSVAVERRRRHSDVTSGDDVTVTSAADVESSCLDKAFLSDCLTDDIESVQTCRPSWSPVDAAVHGRQCVTERLTLDDDASFVQSPLSIPTACDMNLSLHLLLKNRHVSRQASRDLAVQRLLDLESSFVKVMSRGAAKFSRPLRHCAFVTPRLWALLFQNVEKLTALSEYHIQLLLNCSAGTGKQFLSVGLVYAQKWPILVESYSEYHCGLPAALHLAKHLVLAKKLPSLLDTSECDNFGLEAYIRQPVQHFLNMYHQFESLVSPEDDRITAFIVQGMTEKLKEWNDCRAMQLQFT